MSSDKKMLEALDNIENIIKTDVKDKALVMPSSDSMCSKYHHIKKFIQIVLPYISKIPVYGSKIVVILEFLMTIADKLCPANNVK